MGAKSGTSLLNVKDAKVLEAALLVYLQWLFQSSQPGHRLWWQGQHAYMW